MAILQSSTIAGKLTISGSVDQTVALPNYTNTERDALSAAAGDIVFNESNAKTQFYTGNAWADAVGRQGAQGAQGYQGLHGTPGGQGHQGDAGAQGAVGSKGSAGPQGYHGAVGYQGSVGADGDRAGKGPGGDTGYQGLQGATNNSGGAQGPKGPKGPKGSAGYTGYMGGAGGAGGTGNRGSRSGGKGPGGATGPTGYQGNTNNQGGAQGPKGGGGSTGPPGVSNTGNLYYAFGPGSNWPGPQFARIFLGGTWNSNHGVDARGGNTAGFEVDNYYPASYGWRQYVNSNPYSWTFRGDGNPGNSLHYLKSNGNYYHKGNVQSDQRMKKDITAYTASVLDTKIKDDINASSYIFIGNEVSKSEWTASADDQANIGFIAQHLTASAPELVDMRDLSGLGVDDGGLTAILTKAFQEVSSSLSDLGSRISVLEA
jgi:hypothetical protein